MNHRSLLHRHTAEKSPTCASCDEPCEHAAGAGALWVAPDGRVVPYVVCRRCANEALRAGQAGLEAMAERVELRLGATAGVA